MGLSLSITATRQRVAAVRGFADRAIRQSRHTRRYPAHSHHQTKRKALGAPVWAGDYASNRMNCSGRDARSLNLQRPTEPIQPVSDAQPTRLVGKLPAIPGVCRTSKIPTSNADQTVGAGLPAMAFFQPACVPSDPPLSLASQLPQVSLVDSEIACTKKAMPLSGHRLHHYRLNLIPAVCTQSRSHPSWCPASRGRRQRAGRIACRPCRCRSSGSLDHLLADALSTTLYRS